MSLLCLFGKASKKEQTNKQKLSINLSSSFSPRFCPLFIFLPLSIYKMAPRKSTSTLSSQQFPLEFQADDDAWYAIRLLLHGKTLIIKYERFSADYDDFFKAAEFMNLDDVESFGWRFRKVSLQLQDNECIKFVGCMTICASHAFAEDDLCFYDAIVEKVYMKSL